MSSPIENVFDSLSLIAGSEAVMAAAQAWITKQQAAAAPASPAPAASSLEEKPLDKMNCQELRDIYHALIGKPAGLKNSGKMKNKEMLVAEIQRLRTPAAAADAPAAAAEAPAVAEAKPKKAKKAAKAKAAAPAPAPASASASSGAEAPAADEEKPKRKAAPATLAWQQFVKDCKTKYPARFLDAEVRPMRLAESMGVVKAIRAEMPEYYNTFVADFVKNHTTMTTMAEVAEATAEVAETKAKND
jgi:hypothetical protein